MLHTSVWNVYSGLNIINCYNLVKLVLINFSILDKVFHLRMLQHSTGYIQPATLLLLLRTLHFMQN